MENQIQKGRPTEYTDEVALAICSRISDGESVRRIAKDPDMPSTSTIYRWLLDPRYKAFWDHYEKARNIQAEQLFEEILEIADDSGGDQVEKVKEDGTTYRVANAEYVQRSRLRVDTRKWFLSKVLPKKFGDKLDVSTEGRVNITFDNAFTPKSIEGHSGLLGGGTNTQNEQKNKED